MSSTVGDVQPFQAEFSDEALNDLRGRIAATRWPTKGSSRTDRTACS